MSAEVLAEGMRSEPALTSEHLDSLLQGYGRVIGPATLRQSKLLRSRLVAAWSQPEDVRRHFEQEQTLHSVALCQRGDLGPFSDDQTLKLPGLAMMSNGRSEVTSWALQLQIRNSLTVATDDGQKLHFQSAYALVEAASIMAPALAGTGSGDLLDPKVEDHLVHDLTTVWPVLVSQGWGEELEQARNWWRTILDRHRIPAHQWFLDHPLFCDYAGFLHPPFASWWESQLSGLRAARAERSASQAAAEKRAQKHATAIMFDSLSNRSGSSGSGLTVGNSNVYGHQTDYLGGWTPRNGYWDPTVKK